jgi:hypothetical protein
MSDKLFQQRSGLVADPAVAKAYYEAVPRLSELLEEGGVGIQGITTIRNAIDGRQDVYLLRRRGIVEEYHWRAWASAFAVLSRTPACGSSTTPPSHAIRSIRSSRPTSNRYSMDNRSPILR